MANFNMDLTEADCEGRRWIELAQNRFQCIQGVEPSGSDARTSVPYYCMSVRMHLREFIECFMASHTRLIT
jgi:hypothetical protein